VEGQVTRRVEPAPRALLQAPLHDLRHRRGDSDGHRLRLGMEDGVPALHNAACRKGSPAAEHLVQHRAQTEEVRPDVDRITPNLLGRHVPRRSQHHSRSGVRARGRHRRIHQPVRH
jgi:hypothetical protein